MLNAISQFLKSMNQDEVMKNYNREHGLSEEMDLTVKLPPKDTASEEEKKSYQEYVRNLNYMQNAIYEVSYTITDPKKQNLKNEAYYKKMLSNAKGMASGDYKKFRISSFSDAEKKERAEIQKAASDTMASYQSKYACLSDVFIQASNNFQLVKNFQDKRSAAAFFSIGAKSTEDFLKRIDILTNGKKEERQALFENILMEGRKLINKYSVFKNDLDFSKSMKEDALGVFALSEFDGTKINDLAATMGFDYSKNSRAFKIIDGYQSIANSVSSSIQRLGLMANPYYSFLDERNMDLMNHTDYNEPLYFDEPKSYTMEDMKESKVSVIDAYFQYKNSYDVVTMPVAIKDYFEVYLKNHPGCTFTMDGGKSYTDPVKDAESIISDLSNHKKFMVKDKNGNFITLMHQDRERCAGLIIDDEVNDKIDFHKDPVSSITYLKQQLKGVSGWLNHKEFKAVSKAINSFAGEYKKNPDKLDDLVKNIGDLSKKYVESKYKENAPRKNATTYKREKLFSMLYKQTELFKNPSALDIPVIDPVAPAPIKREPMEIPGEVLDANTKKDEISKEDLLEKNEPAKDNNEVVQNLE